MTTTEKPLSKRLQPALRALEKDLLERARLPPVEDGLRVAWEAEKAAGETGQGFDPWRRARVTQIAVAWVLSVVFVRTLEDRGLIDPRVAGPGEHQLKAARDREAAFVQLAPFLGPREYLLTVFRELAHLPGAREVFDARHNPVWVLAPSSEGARALLDFFQQVDAGSGAPALTFPGTETRFLGDLYQDLSEAVRKRYALLQTPDFVEKFILEQTLHPAIAEYGLSTVRLIDPTCGSGHFLLGAFRDLLERWRQAEPMTPVEELARRALGQVNGVDINPYAVAIARFRLVLAVLDAVGTTRLDQAPAVQPKVVVADSLLHRLQAQQRLSQQVSMAEWASWGDALFRLSDAAAVGEMLGQRYHAVVGNPPYITEKDAEKKKRYRATYAAATHECPLATAFSERFFDLAVIGGFVGAIVSNAFTKRDSGIALVQKVLANKDVQKIVDTSGCYLPGHGTPTLLLYGRNRSPGSSGIHFVLGKRGEREVPANPTRAPVWTEIVENHHCIGFDGSFVSIESVPRVEAQMHPWVLTGGGARALLEVIKRSCRLQLSQMITVLGAGAVTRADEVYLLPRRAVGPDGPSVKYVTGTHVRDWTVDSDVRILFPYEGGLTVPLEALRAQRTTMFCHRTFLWTRRGTGFKTKKESGGHYFEYSMWYPDRFRQPLKILHSYVSTHNNFAFARDPVVNKNHAPLILLAAKYLEADHQALLGYLNSSTVGFWCRLVMFPKGGDQVGEGARLSKTPWQDRLEYAGNLLQQLPVPDLARLKHSLLDLVVAAEETVAAIGALDHDKVVAATLADRPNLAALRLARDRALAERARLRGVLVSLQEEMDWRVYGLFDLPTATAGSLDAVRVPVAPNHRPFEVRLAREVATDISASEWFRVHKRSAPADVDGPLADLYRQRLRLLDDPERGRQLRLLETPETKRRWSPPDEPKAFRDAVRAWLLERMEAAFRDQPQPELRTARQLALELGRDPAVAAAHELLTEESGADLVRLFSDLVDADGVPHLAGYRYSEPGLEKRTAWEETWRLQRLEDAGALEPELKRLGLKAIPVPDKYVNKDFLRHYWGLRGKLDVPKERFITVPGGNSDDDPTPLVGWAGWDHLQAAQALAGLYQRRKAEDGWTKDRLLPLLAGLAERVPWLLQWHNAPSDAFGGMKLGEFFRDFVTAEAYSLGVAVDFAQATDALRTWTPPAAPKRKSLDPAEVLAALQRWRPEVDEDDAGDDEEPPEGPTPEELASEIGVSKTLVAKVLKKLEVEGRVERLEGRAARYVAVGGE
jgi:hypothetical protein